MSRGERPYTHSLHGLGLLPLCAAHRADLSRHRLVAAPLVFLRGLAGASADLWGLDLLSSVAG